MIAMPRKAIPKTSIKSVQYDLFCTFYGEPIELSNTIELWDSIPKYSVSYRRQNYLRTEDNRLPVHEYEFNYALRQKGQRMEHSCRVSVQPAAIKIDGDYIDYYPSTDEELVEEVLRKIFTVQHQGLHDSHNNESWVRFSVQMIRRELASRKKSRSITEIKRSIEILSKTHVSLYLDDSSDPVYSASILSDVTQVTRGQYIDDPSLSWVARLPALVSKSVNELTYRQFNYGVLMGLNSQLARWIHKRLSHNYTNASHMHPYDVLFRTIQRDSGLLPHARTNDAVRALEKALDQLVTKQVLTSWESLDDRRKRRNAIGDIKYRLHPHANFIKDVVAANARLKHSHQKAALPATK